MTVDEICQKYLDFGGLKNIFSKNITKYQGRFSLMFSVLRCRARRHKNQIDRKAAIAAIPATVPPAMAPTRTFFSELDPGNAVLDVEVALEGPGAGPGGLEMEVGSEVVGTMELESGAGSLLLHDQRG
jgi:hypothetical protein